MTKSCTEPGTGPWLTGGGGGGAVGSGAVAAGGGAVVGNGFFFDAQDAIDVAAIAIIAS